MSNLFITLFIAIANIVAILLIYHSFDKNLEKTKKLLYTMISMGVMYILILIVYFFSSIGLPKEATTESKDMITFTFVPVNAIILLPILIRSFNKRKNKTITTGQLNARAIIVVIIGIIVLISEFFYFRNIQKGILELVTQKQESQSENVTDSITSTNTTLTNEIKVFTVNDTIDNSSNFTTGNSIPSYGGNSTPSYDPNLE